MKIKSTFDSILAAQIIITKQDSLIDLLKLTAKYEQDILALKEDIKEYEAEDDGDKAFDQYTDNELAKKI